ncbi:hypothetical protein V8C44DRAFT_339306 [Trichoderma aethiopicum]
MVNESGHVLTSLASNKGAHSSTSTVVSGFPNRLPPVRLWGETRRGANPVRSRRSPSTSTPDAPHVDEGGKYGSRWGFHGRTLRVRPFCDLLMYLHWYTYNVNYFASKDSTVARIPKGPSPVNSGRAVGICDLLVPLATIEQHLTLGYMYVPHSRCSCARTCYLSSPRSRLSSGCRRLRCESDGDLTDEEGPVYLNRGIQNWRASHVHAYYL